MNDEITPEQLVAELKPIVRQFQCTGELLWVKTLENVAAALERCAELDEKLRANLADFDRVKARAHEVAERARVIGEQRDKAEKRCAELERLLDETLSSLELYGEWGLVTKIAAFLGDARQQPGDAGEEKPEQQKTAEPRDPAA